MTHTEQEIADSLAHVDRCRADLMSESKCPEHHSHGGAVSLDACVALDAITGALVALRAGAAALAEFDENETAESLAAQLHDMASDVFGRARKRMAEPAWSHAA